MSLDDLKEPQRMTAARRNPRILIVTPEVTYLPDDMGNIANYLKAKAGGMADVSDMRDVRKIQSL